MCAQIMFVMCTKGAKVLKGIVHIFEKSYSAVRRNETPKVKQTK